MATCQTEAAVAAPFACAHAHRESAGSLTRSPAALRWLADAALRPRSVMRFLRRNAPQARVSWAGLPGARQRHGLPPRAGGVRALSGGELAAFLRVPLSLSGFLGSGHVWPNQLLTGGVTAGSAVRSTFHCADHVRASSQHSAASAAAQRSKAAEQSRTESEAEASADGAPLPPLCLSNARMYGSCACRHSYLLVHCPVRDALRACAARLIT